MQEVLNGAFAEGRLTQQEWEQRTSELASAKTYADLDRLIADLPGHSLRPQYPPPGALEPWKAPQRTNGLAIAALVCGIGQLVAFWPATILAIVFGHKARRDIRRTGEQGDGLARAGIILGYIGLGISLLMVLVLLLGVATMTHSVPGHVPVPRVHGLHVRLLG